MGADGSLVELCRGHSPAAEVLGAVIWQEQPERREAGELPKEQRRTGLDHNLESTGLYGWVYFIRRADGRVKIGQSMNPEKRMKDLQCAAGPLELLLKEVGGAQREHELHDQFAADRVHGEWFEMSDALAGYIAEKRTEEVVLEDFPSDLARALGVPPDFLKT